jgi:hypothetical protein
VVANIENAASALNGLDGKPEACGQLSLGVECAVSFIGNFNQGLL